MKVKIIIAVLTLLCIFNASGQTDSIRKKYKHELGADLTGLLKQFFNFNQGIGGYNPYYTPTYYFTYRYHLKKSNIRFGVGASYSNRAVGTHSVNGVEIKATITSSNFSFRFGYEGVSELSNKWQAFYGFDFRPSFVNENDNGNSSGGGYINGSVTASQVFGFAPLLGFRFRISKRVSILTETSLSFNIEVNSSQRTSVSMDNILYPPIPWDKKVKTTDLNLGFNPPLFLVLAVDL